MGTTDPALSKRSAELISDKRRELTVGGTKYNIRKPSLSGAIAFQVVCSRVTNTARSGTNARFANDSLRKTSVCQQSF
jgi:hypothetical protein